jgi:LmbE family N-acetylglucosaminyl deacetylase
LSRGIACILAHPDDETFTVGGIVAKYASAGHPISLWCATNGDAGKSAGVPVSSREELAALRRNEMLMACRILGVGTVEMPAYTDGALHNTDATELTRDIVSFIRRNRPAVVLTFGPEGAPTGHHDHAAISRVATAAFFLAALKTVFADLSAPPHAAQRLFYHAWEYPMPDPRLSIESVRPTCAIDVRQFKAVKEAAFKAHATQQGSAQAFYSSALKDTEHLALASGVPQPRTMITDLFEGLLPLGTASP